MSTVRGRQEPPVIAEGQAVYLSPDCRDGNPTKCDGLAWDLGADALVECGCQL